MIEENQVRSLGSVGIYVHKGHFVQSKTSKLSDDYVIGKVYNQLIQELGKGAYGVVFAAKSKITGKIRAIKQIKRSSIRNPIQFTNEMDILKKVDHPNIIKVY